MAKLNSLSTSSEQIEGRAREAVPSPIFTAWIFLYSSWIWEQQTKPISWLVSKHKEPGEFYKVAIVSTSQDTQSGITRVQQKYRLSITQILQEKWTPRGFLWRVMFHWALGERTLQKQSNWCIYKQLSRGLGISTHLIHTGEQVEVSVFARHLGNGKLTKTCNA
jgi:hypothetical protein